MTVATFSPPEEVAFSSSCAVSLATCQLLLFEGGYLIGPLQ